MKLVLNNNHKSKGNMDDYQTTMLRRQDAQDLVLRDIKHALVGNPDLKQKGLVDEIRGLKKSFDSHVEDDVRQFGDLKTFKTKLTAMATAIGLGGGADVI